MMVCFICSSYPAVPCGVGDHTATLAAGLRDRGVNVRVITTRRPEVTAAGDVLPLLRSWGFRQLPRLLRAVRATRADLVHIQYPAAFYGRSPAVIVLPLLIRLTLGKPTVVTIHEWSARERRGRLASALLASLATHVVMPDQVERERLLGAVPFLRKRITVVPQMASIPTVPADVTAVRRELGVDASTFVLAFFGLIKPVHQLNRVITVFAELARRRSAVLIVIGGVAAYAAPQGERYRESLAALAAECGVADRVRWLGFLPAPRVSACLQAADACILPFTGGVAARNTTFHAVVAHGVPLITTVGVNTPGSLVDRYPTVHFIPEERFRPADVAALLAGLAGRRGPPGQDMDIQIEQACLEHIRVYQTMLGRGPERDGVPPPAAAR
jgi:glycosyltransferase involved in cell wall biosynthesis